jgi:hypothetical protein
MSKALTPYQKARCVYEYVLGDGKEHTMEEIETELRRYGFDPESDVVMRVEDRLCPIMLVDTDEATCTFTVVSLRLPKHRKPANVTTWMWAVMFLRKRFACNRIQDRLELMLDAQEYQIPLTVLFQARTALGITIEDVVIDGEETHCWVWPDAVQ